MRSIINNLKRRPEDAADDLGISLEEMNRILDEEIPLSEELIKKACSVWPISPREFSCLIDDAPTGIKIMRKNESLISARIMERNGRPYYEYRDTAASSLSKFRPEWIKELEAVENNDVDNKLVQWNNGHFMHQFTYFVGPVNFYYIDELGNKKVYLMNTGDSMYIRPFVPHTFTTRKDDGGEGIILALTYGSSLSGDAEHELKAIGKELAINYPLSFSSKENSVGNLIGYYLNCFGITHEELSSRTELGISDIENIVSGKTELSVDKISQIASAINVNLKDLLVYEATSPKGVEISVNNKSTWEYKTSEGKYLHRELACSPIVPLARSLEIWIDQNNVSDYGLKIGLHQYLYNVGETDIEIKWRDKENTYQEIISPDDSVYLKPFVEHCFNAKSGKMISLRIPSSMDKESIIESSHIGKKYFHRVVKEKICWFNKDRL